MKIRSARLATVLVATALLAACSRDEPERPIGNTQPDAEATTAPLTEPETAPTPRIPAPDAAIQSNAIDELSDAPAEAEAPPAPDQQMLDDASATGMTARANRDTPSDEAPADVVEQK